MSNALFVDISSWQNPVQVDWLAYKTWSAQGDGISRILFRDDQGIGVVDSAFEQFWAAALRVGIDEIFVYHYAYPNMHPGAAGAAAEAQSMESVVGSRLRPRDKVMLDLEQNESSGWAIAFGQELLKWHPTASRPVIYDSLSHIQQFLTDPQLAQIYDLGLAAWTFDPNSRPKAPAPWTSYTWLQYSDRLVVPGIPGVVDANVFLGGDFMVPQGPFVSVTAGKGGVEAVGNQIAAHFGLSWDDLCNIADPQSGQDNSHLKKYDPSVASLVGPGSYGVSFLVPFYPALLAAAAGNPLADAAKTALKDWLAS